jgi:uncharacterized protein (DUF2336 family)
MRSPQLAEELEAALASGSPTRRSEILDRITDLFVRGAERYSPEHVQLFGEIMAQLLHGLDAAGRARLAERLAPIANAPGNIIERLAADDDIAVAGCVLIQSATLTERNLLAIADSKSRAHLLAISCRQVLSAALTEVLIARGDHEVLAALAGNNTAQFSEAGRRQIERRWYGGAVSAFGRGRARPGRMQIGESEVNHYARRGNLAETAGALSMMSGLPNDAVERALLNSRAEAVLVLAKAAGLSSVTTEAILHMRAMDAGMSTRDVAQAVAKFNRLPRDSARRVLNFFRIRLERPTQPIGSAPAVLGP